MFSSIISDVTIVGHMPPGSPPPPIFQNFEKIGPHLRLQDTKCSQVLTCPPPPPRKSGAPPGAPPSAPENWTLVMTLSIILIVQNLIKTLKHNYLL